MKKIILIDLDNTLVDTDRAHTLAFQRATSGISKNSLTMATEKITTMKRCRPNDLTAEHVALHLQIALRTETSEFSVSELQNRYNLYTKVFYENLKIVNGAKDFLLKARENLLPVIVVSNGFLDTCVRKLSSTDLDVFISDIVTPEIYGFGKENNYLFKFILEEWGANPQNAIMIGDNLLVDGGCRQLGMEFFHITREESFKMFHKGVNFINDWCK